MGVRDIVQLYTMVRQIKYACKINNTKLNIIQIQYNYYRDVTFCGYSWEVA